MEPTQELIRLGLFAYAGFLLGRGVATCVHADDNCDLLDGVIMTSGGAGLHWYLTIFT